MSRWVVALAIGWVGPVGLGAFGLKAAEPAPPAPAAPGYNVVFVSMTNTRADHLGIYGYDRDTSPRIDALARRGVVFQRAFSHASWTLPVVMSLFTSQYPFAHGMMNRQQDPVLPAATPTFVDVLKGHGYQTAAFVGGRDYDPRFGHVSRFDTVLDTAAKAPLEDWKGYGVFEHGIPAAREWLRVGREPDRPFFLLVQGYDTHCPFAVPRLNNQFDPGYRGEHDFRRCYWTFEPTRPIQVRTPAGEYEEVYTLMTKPVAGDDYEVQFFPEDIRHMEALYDGEIRNADALVGSLLDDLQALGLERTTLVVVYSDHGDMFGKHGRFMRGGPLRGTFYDDVLRIPLILFHPELPARTVEELAQVIDIGPTLLDYLGLAAPGSFRGRSLRPAIETSAPVHPRVFAGSEFTPSADNRFFRHRSLILAVRDREWKLVWEKLDLGPGREDRVELYDLRRDPRELVNVAARHPDKVEQCRAWIRQWVAEEAPMRIREEMEQP